MGSGQAQESDDLSDLVHRPELFESSAWLRIDKYHPLQIELDLPPRSTRPDGVTLPQVIMVQAKHAGRTGKRGPRTAVYGSLTQAMRANGRWVRWSLDAGREVKQGWADRAYPEKVEEKHGN